MPPNVFFVARSDFFFRSPIMCTYALADLSVNRTKAEWKVQVSASKP